MCNECDWANFSRALIIVNPTAGVQSCPDVVEELRALCEGSLESVETLRTSERDQATATVAGAVACTASDGALLVIAVGGDGTVREVVEGLARGLGRWPGTSERKGEAALFVVPAGSGNSAYQALWHGRAWRETLELALDSGGCRVRDVDLIRLSGSDRASLLGVNFGLIARIAQMIEERKLRSGPRTEGADDSQRYWDAFSEVLRDIRPFPACVEVDDEPIYRGLVTLVTVGGVRAFGRGSFQLLPHALLDDGRLDVCIVTDLGRQRLVELSALVPAGQHLGEPEVVYAQGSRVLVRRVDGRRLLLEHDGDPHVACELVALEVAAGAAPILAPAWLRQAD
jgi:diacylglycerol kinase (ATP)